MEKIKCPNKGCGKEIEIDNDKLDWHKHGRVTKCPECGKKIFFRSHSKGYVRNENGSLVRVKR